MVNDPLDDFKCKQPHELLGGLEYELVTHFFAVFSRFEHALKLTGYLREGELACPAWRRFSSEMIGKLSPVPSKKLKDAIQFLNESPPQKQLQSLEWTKNSFPKECIDCDSKAIIAATGVRNNLFHGGKYKRTDPERDTKLIISALAVVHGCLFVREDIKAQYEIIF